MTTTDEQYTPSDDEVRETWVATDANPEGYALVVLNPPSEVESRAEFDRFLTRVRRDALTALADHWDETVSERAGRPLFSASGTHVRHYRDTHCPIPEETP